MDLGIAGRVAMVAASSKGIGRGGDVAPRRGMPLFLRRERGRRTWRCSRLALLASFSRLAAERRPLGPLHPSVRVVAFPHEPGVALRSS